MTGYDISVKRVLWCKFDSVKAVHKLISSLITLPERPNPHVTTKGMPVMLGSRGKQVQYGMSHRYGAGS